MSQESIVEQVLNEALRQPRKQREEYVLRQEHLSQSVREELVDLLAYHDTQDGSVDRTEPSINELWFGKPTVPGYRIGGMIGSGGMGRVYHARQVSPSRPVAIKFLKPSLASDAKARARFTREAELMAGLDHPGIVRVFDSMELPDTCCIVMQYVSGPNSDEPLNLAQSIRSNPGGMAAEEVQAAMLQLAKALGYAHEKGVVHRDIKPSNILLDERNQLRVTDFGVALVSFVGVPKLTTNLTVLGTYDYMSPEQLDGDSVIDHRSDIYSLGVVFYEMLAGEVPRGSFRSPGELRSDGFDGFDSCVRRACSPKPKDRYATMEEFGRAIESVCIERRSGSSGEPPNTDTDNHPPSSSRRLAIAAVTLFSIAIAAIGWAIVQNEGWPKNAPALSGEKQQPSGRSASLGIESDEAGSEWITIPSRGTIEVRDDRITNTAVGHGAAIYREWRDVPTRVRVEVIPTIDGQGATDRFTHIAFFAEAPGTKTGYGVTISRTSKRFSNSQVSVFGPDGNLETMTPPFDLGGKLILDFVVDADSQSLTGSVTDQTSREFKFDVDIGPVQKPLRYFGLQLGGGPGVGNGVLPAFEKLHLEAIDRHAASPAQ